MEENRKFNVHMSRDAASGHGLMTKWALCIVKSTTVYGGGGGVCIASLHTQNTYTFVYLHRKVKWECDCVTFVKARYHTALFLLYH